MESKAFLALALIAVIGRPAWGQDSSPNMNSDPYSHSDDRSAADGADVGGSEGERPGASLCGGDATSGGAGGESMAGAGASSTASADPCRRAPVAEALPDPGQATSNPYEADLARSLQRDRDAYERVYDPLKPPKELPSPSYGASASDSYGLGLGAREPPAAAQPKYHEFNGDPLGTLGFNPYDVNSILAPKSPRGGPGARPSAANPLGSPLPTSVSPSPASGQEN
jgi:hypothetical protein